MELSALQDGHISSTQTGEDSETIFDLDRQISSYIFALADLRARRNRLAAISRLPPELLASIFVWVKSVQSYGDPRRGSPYGWAVVTIICRHWTAVAESTPELWKTIYVTENTPLKIGQMRLDRSGQLPLEVHVYSSDYSPLPVASIRIVLRGLHRTTWLSLGTSAHSTLDAYHVGPLSAPYLRELQLESSNPSSIPHLSFFSWCATPILRKLRMDMCTIQPSFWKAGALPRSLAILILSIQVNDSQTLPGIARTIGDLVLLENLDLELRTGTHFHGPGPNVSVVNTLPHLRILALSMRASAFSVFLDSFNIPLFTTIKLFVVDKGGPDAVLAPLTTSVSSILRGTISAGFANTSSVPDGAIISNYSLKFFMHGAPLNPRLSIRVLASETIRSLVTFCTGLVLSNVTDLIISTYRRDHPWSQIFAQFHSVETVDIGSLPNRPEMDCVEVERVIRTLQMHVTTPGGTTADLVLPRLKRITLTRLHFMSLYEMAEAGVEPRLAIADTLGKVLRVREEKGQRVEEVVFRDCVYFTEVGMDSLPDTTVVKWYESVGVTQ
ncbi:hypothetical protein BXZ70DRAFT_951901 [Cristinia sonorae]|uniref:F-box domain-containing protein n=1 Tax=Cristinia sonorae TaxID=1940300 RepID=A0A8K0UIN1_9AGAR|nr:hypothetical protein BXZ70DRAFT_951901 [Cristinia sonorae]